MNKNKVIGILFVTVLVMVGFSSLEVQTREKRIAKEQAADTLSVVQSFQDAYGAIEEEFSSPSVLDTIFTDQAAMGKAMERLNKLAIIIRNDSTNTMAKVEFELLFDSLKNSSPVLNK